ncbi:hypothetical protein HHK36_005893 [Tetracentron sinense]|uniref:Jacalin-type lectin domain-containing protein n=1 Tax=Tetracentron sinense TaxID=13715 RepID=A0A834ZLC0_TETSI|nr:hypothetical protein HHK36_005893 [Tetracentron sinense]
MKAFSQSYDLIPNVEIDLDWPRECLTSISGSYDLLSRSGPVVIRSLSFITTLTKYGPFGSESGTFFSFPMKGRVITGFHGRSGVFLDSIGVYVKHTSLALLNHKTHTMAVVQSLDDLSADDSIGKEGPGVGVVGNHEMMGVFAAIKQIYVHRGNIAIYSIQLEYDKTNGESVWSPRHGGLGGDITNRIKLDCPSEFLICITGFYRQILESGGHDIIQSLSLFTNKGLGEKC